MDPDRFSIEIALTAIETAARPERWGTLCDRIADGLGAPAFMVFAYNTETHGAPVAHVSSNFRTPRAAALLAQAQSGTATEDHRGYSTIAARAPGHVIGEREGFGIGPDDPLPENAFRDMALAASGGRSRSAVKLNGFGPFLDCAITHDHEPGGSPSKALQTAAPFLVPLLGRTLESARIVAALTKSYAMLMSLFDRLDFGAAFCQPSGRLLTSNRAFGEMTVERYGVAEANGYLRAVLRRDEAALRAALSAAARPAAGPDSLTVTLGRRSRALPLVCHVMPVHEGEVAAEPVLLTLLIDPESSARISAQGLAALGTLSAAELDVCALLVRGFSTERIAERRDTSIETTRGQIKDAAAKLACRGRLDLLRLAMVTASPLRRASDRPPSGG